jgi:creatinine amidohydrolase
MTDNLPDGFEQKLLYTELTPTAFRERVAAAPIAYLPLGTLEWHGEHLPLGSDGLQSQGFFVALARRVGGIVLPMLFLGPDMHENEHGSAFYGMDLVGFPKGAPEQLEGSAYWVDEALFRLLLEAILARLARAGFKIVVAHGHGPSTKFFEQHSQVWSKKFGLKLLICWDEVNGDAQTGLMTDHAAANETSLMLALHPDLVKMDLLPADPQVWPRAIMGADPRVYASAESGREILRKNLAWLEKVLRQLLLEIKA